MTANRDALLRALAHAERAHADAERAVKELRVALGEPDRKPTAEWVSPKEAAFLLGNVSEDTVLRWCRSRNIGEQPGGPGTPWKVNIHKALSRSDRP